MSDKGVPVSFNEFYWKVVGSAVSGIVKGKVISSVGFLGDPHDGSCDIRREVWF